MLSPADHITLTQLTTRTEAQGVTPDEAQFIHQRIRINSWPKAHSIRWIYPVDEHGGSIAGVSQSYTHPIRKPRPLKAPRQPDPTSLNTRQPWLDEGIHRTTWFARKAAAPRLSTLLAGRPLWMSEAEGLKLHAVLVVFAVSHTLDINRLWKAVCEGLRGMEGEG